MKVSELTRISVPLIPGRERMWRQLFSQLYGESSLGGQVAVLQGPSIFLHLFHVFKSGASFDTRIQISQDRKCMLSFSWIL